MALKSGTLGFGTLDGVNEVIAYEVQAPAVAGVFTLSVCNKGALPVAVFVSHGTGAKSQEAGTAFWEFSAIVKPGIPLERTGLALSVGRKVFISSDTAGVDYSIHGFEKG